MFICLCLLSFTTHIFSCAHSGFNKFCRLCRKLKYINIQLQFWPLPTISYSDIKNVGSGRDFGGALFCVCEHGQFPDICGFTICILLQLFLAFRVFHKFGRHEFCYEKWTSCPGCNADLNRVNDNVCWSLNSNVLYGACLSRQDKHQKTLQWLWYSEIKWWLTCKKSRSWHSVFERIFSRVWEVFLRPWVLITI